MRRRDEGEVHEMNRLPAPAAAFWALGLAQTALLPLQILRERAGKSFAYRGFFFAFWAADPEGTMSAVFMTHFGVLFYLSSVLCLSFFYLLVHGRVVDVENSTCLELLILILPKENRRWQFRGLISLIFVCLFFLSLCTKQNRCPKNFFH